MEIEMSSSTIERRATRAPLELRQVEGGCGSLHGYGILFNTPSQDLGGFKETIAPTAVDLGASRDVRFLFGHDDSQILGRMKNGSLQLAIDERGVSFSLALPDTTLGRDTRELVRLGTLDGMSFGFRAVKDTWSADRRARTVEKLELFELSCVTFPAYATASTVLEARDVTSARSATVGVLQKYRHDQIEAQLAPRRLALTLADRRYALTRAMLGWAPAARA
jgi:HK97 family phage prohead protease